MENKTKLKDCPFCGSSAAVIKNSGRPKGSPAKVHAACNNVKCGAYAGLTWCNTTIDAAKAWNTRQYLCTEKGGEKIVNIFIGTSIESFSKRRQQEIKAYLLSIQDSYIRMASNDDPQYRIQQQKHCENNLDRLTEIYQKALIESHGE